MAGKTSKWFWTAVAAGVLSLAGMFAAKLCAVKAARLMARATQAIADGAAADSQEGSKIAAARYAQGSETFDVIALLLVVVMAAAWASSHSRHEQANHIVLLALLILGALFYFLFV